MAGVGAGTGALGSVLVKLATLLSDEYKLLKGVRKEIAFLERELRRMQILVNTLAGMEKLDDLAKDWKGNMRELSYDMEDCIDRFMVRFGNGDAKPGFMKKTASHLKTLFARHDIGNQIKELKARVVEESERRQRLNLENYVTSPTRTVEIDPRLHTFHEVVKDLVAIDYRRDQVISWLTEDSAELKVVAIFGGGGLGKTTLAMEVYRKIKGDFQCGASVSVSRTPDLKQLLKDVLSQIDEAAFRKCQLELERWSRWTIDILIRQIQESLTGKRYFVVIDDVWKQEDWKIFKAAFPDNDNGSRIIATTRNKNVAKSSCSNFGDHLYQMAALSDADSRRLFFKRIFHSDNSCPPHLEEVSAKILKKCGGVPLAIITIASLLANKPQHTDEWERLQNAIGTGLSYENDDGGTGMRDILLFSYWDLPHHLKTCLLYLCIYPEDHRIDCEELKWKWIAEGFVATQWGNVSQEAENFFNEIVNRSMIQPVDVDYDEGVKYCQVHDMMLDLIISLSQEENFATILNRRVVVSLPSRVRRVSIQSGSQEHKRAMDAITESKLHVRSLNVIGRMMQIPPLVDFQALRVLDYGQNGMLENKHIKNIGSLSQLRYLRLNSRVITELPDDIGNLEQLETLDLQGCESIKRLPPTMVRLRKLMRLIVVDVVLPAEMFGSMQAIEEVSNIRRIDNRLKFAEKLVHLTKLRKLTIFSDRRDRYIHLEDGYKERYFELLGTSLRELGRWNLQYLHISGEIGDYLFRDPSYTFPFLKVLETMTYMERVHIGMASLSNIVKLYIQVTIFDEEGLHLLMGMPSLAHLQLGVFFEPGHEKRPIVGKNGFKRLKVFRYTFLWSNGTGIAFAPGAMPALRRLHLVWQASSVMSGGGADMGIEHLSGLANLEVENSCMESTVGEVEAVEASVEKAIALHPNRHNLQVHLRREFEHTMYKDDKERVEAEKARNKGAENEEESEDGATDNIRT